MITNVLPPFYGSQCRLDTDCFRIFPTVRYLVFLSYSSFIFRSTPKIRPNNVGQMSVRTSVRPSVRPSTKSFSDSDEIWYVGRDRWVTVCEIRGGQEGSDPQKYEGSMQSCNRDPGDGSHKKTLIVNCI